MTRRTWLRVAVAVALVALVGGGAAFLMRHEFFAPTRYTAYFASAASVYAGDDVRVAGVNVGTIESVEVQGTQVKMTLNVEHGVSIPADAKAVIVAPNLVAARYVQLTPAYESSGSILADGAVIPLERTAVPVEWDEVKEQLTRLATDLGPSDDTSNTSVGRFIESAADAMDGNGGKLRQMITQLSEMARIVADGGGSIADIIKNLQVFVTALRDSNTQIVSFQNRLATLSSVLEDSTPDLDATLTNLSSAVGDVQRFIAGSRDQTADHIRRLGNVTQNLVDHKTDLENVLHVAPNAFGNTVNSYNPDTGSILGSFALNNFSNPMQFWCGVIGATDNATSAETAKLCAQYLGPAARQMNFNYLPFPVNPVLMPSPRNVVYSDPALAPGGAGPAPGPLEAPLGLSAYGPSGVAANPGQAAAPAAPPPFTGRAPGIPPPGASPGDLPTTGRTVLETALPGAAEMIPAAPSPTLQDMLLPAERSLP
ncbi:MCE family protein [Mycolicibacterium vaccae]|jgi:phospholipid/cholesterol/gamma-HCH transport system substrate-binding protein|uniref:MCE family protein n=1 Tax=Mycolicibacterium vaccae TaxID=1810 RepID=UPI00030F476D|nr:MCE family protein [Mycolicibacterium vaccae]MCV7063930.1 MCE family protein [Mycolicibacterium vaccae]